MVNTCLLFQGAEILYSIAAPYAKVGSNFPPETRLLMSNASPIEFQQQGKL